MSKLPANVLIFHHCHTFNVFWLKLWLVCILHRYCAVEKCSSFDTNFSDACIKLNVNVLKQHIHWHNLISRGSSSPCWFSSSWSSSHTFFSSLQCKRGPGHWWVSDTDRLIISCSIRLPMCVCAGSCQLTASHSCGSNSDVQRGIILPQTVQTVQYKMEIDKNKQITAETGTYLWILLLKVKNRHIVLLFHKLC